MPAGACVLEYRGKRGLVYRVKYRDASGVQVMETLGAERDGWTRRKAEAELRERLVKVEKRGWRRPRRLLFRDYAEAWLDASATKRSWRENTRRAYRGSMKRILPFFGPLALDAVKPRHIAAFTREAMERYGATTVNQDLNLVHNILASAMREELVETNAANRPERPKMPDHEQRWRLLEPVEIGRVLRAFTDERARIVFLAAVLTAMRRSELVNLRWRDVDFIDGVIRVQKSKSREGVRSIAMPTSLSNALWEWRTKTPYQGDDEYVFASPESGRRMNPDRWWNRHYRAALKKAGIDGYVRPFHDLRHTSLTNEAATGSSPIAIMARAGHASMATTKRYLHLAGVVFKDEATALERRLLGAGAGESQR